MSSLKNNISSDSLDALKKARDEIRKNSPKKKKSKKKPIVLAEVEVGNIYKIEADESNGITPPPGRDKWYKHFVVMGIANDGNLMGCVVFDSKINREHVEPGCEDFYIPISKGKYSFIDHESYLECLKLKPASLANIRQGRFEGKLSEEDLQRALELTKISNRNDYITLCLYNIVS